MKIKFALSLTTGTIAIQREKGDKKVRGGWSPPGGEHGWEAEHVLLYQLKKILNAAGFNLIKKRIQKDGHMVGATETPYLRAKNKKKDKPHIAIYDANSAVRNSAEEYNEGKEIILHVESDMWGIEQDDWQAMIVALCEAAGIECESASQKVA